MSTEEKETMISCPSCGKNFSVEEFKKTHTCPKCDFEDLYHKKLRIATKLAKYKSK